MATVVVANFVSIDGVIQSPLSPEEDRDGGFAHGGWVTPLADETVASFMREVTTGADAMLLGRRSYEILTSAWSEADRSEPAVAAMHRMTKYVVTRSPGTPLPWANSRRLGADPPTEIAGLRDRADGRLVVFGSGELVHLLVAHDLVDEYRLLLFPVVLGHGKRMFDGRAPLAHFALAGSTVTSTGVVLLTYTRSRADG